MVFQRLTLFVPALLMLFFHGCRHAAAPKPVIREVKVYEAPEPAWFLAPPKDDENLFYSVGSGDDAREAVKNAIENLRGRLLEKIEEEGRREKGIWRYMTPKERERVGRLLEKLPVPSDIRSEERRGDGRVYVLTAIDRRAYAKPLNRETMRRLVAIEERWHRAAASDLLTRYRLAKISYVQMKELLPFYVAATRISPFSGKIVRRVENAIPYFAHTAERVKKRLKFCVEPVRVPALRLFASAVEAGLSRRGSAVEDLSSNASGMLCIAVGGDLLHRREGEKHVVEADLSLSLHERYKDPIAVQRYRVKGVSDESGPDALEKAADALEKRIEKAFLDRLVSEWRDSGLR